MGELLEFHNGFNGSSEKYGRGIPLISVMDILSNDFITSENIRIKADLTEKEFQRFKVGYGDVLFQRSSENVEDAGTSNVYLDERKCAVFGGFVICGKKKAEYVSLFLKYGLTNKGVRAQITSKAQGAQHINVSQDTLQGTVILLPSQYEQEKIGNYFRYLDALITLHQRKYEKLLKVKKSMLEKMFPRDGADVPEIRFDGFTDAWEQRKLGDIYIERNERGNAELDILSVSIHHGISQNELDTDELGKSVRRSDDKSLYKHVYYGDLVFNMMRAWQGAIGVVKNEGMVSPAYISAIPDDSVFPEFMDYCLRRKCIINQINNLSYGVTDFRKRLYWEPFTRVTIMMPSVDEQRKITDIFRQLDDLITLHQRKLEKLKNIKKSLLEKMFV